jgi:hypothetical protein
MHPTVYVTSADTLDEFIARATPYLYTPRSDAYATYNDVSEIRARYDATGFAMVMVRAEHFQKDTDPDGFIILRWPLPTW